METKRLIKEKLHEAIDGRKRMTTVKAVMHKCANHLFDAYRELDMAIQYCDDPIVRAKLETIRAVLGRDDELAGYMENDNPSIISTLQTIAKSVKS